MDNETLRRFSEDYPEDREALSSLIRRARGILHALDDYDGRLHRTPTTDRHSVHARRNAGRDCAEMCRLLNYRRAVADGVRPQPEGHYFGDGIARTLDGTPFEPLEWDYLMG